MAQKPQQQAAKPHEQKAAPKFQIDDGVAVPQRMKDIPDYGLPALFASMKKGQSVLLKYTDVPLEHSRTLVQRFARNGGPNDADGKPTSVDMTTRQERAEGAADDADFIGLRVWRNS